MNWGGFNKLQYIIAQPSQPKFSYSAMLINYFWTICIICTPPMFTFLLALNTLLSWEINTLILVPASVITSMVFVYWMTAVMTLYDKMR